MSDKNKDTVSIFGKEYPLYILPTYDKDGKSIVVREENSTAYSDFLPDFFAAQEKHFSKEDYYAKVVEKHPEYKKKWFENTPSEKEIEQFALKKYGHCALDGATSIPKAEKELGVKVGGGYKFPQGMSDIEYHAHCFIQTGLDSSYGNPTTKMEAYIQAWQELHFGSEEKNKALLKEQCAELVELNPQLKEVKFDWNNAEQLGRFRAGVIYNFPKDDIQLFLDECAKGVQNINKNLQLHNQERFTQMGIPNCFNWVLSDKTIDNIALKLKEKEGKTTEALAQNEEKAAPKSPKEQVAERLKAWGVEDGSYMMLTRDDNACIGYGGNDFQSTESYFEYGQRDIQKTGREVVYGRNNGIYGAYFAEGVYVLSTNDKLGEALHKMGEDVGVGVMLSNGEKFENYTLKTGWDRVKDNGDKINAETERQRVAQERNLTFNQVQTMISEMGQTADKHDASGHFKEDLIKTYTENDEKMLSLEFWGNLVQKYATQSPEGKEACLKDIGALGLKLGKDIKENRNNEHYSAVKKSIADEKNIQKDGKAHAVVMGQLLRTGNGR